MKRTRQPVELPDLSAPSDQSAAPTPVGWLCPACGCGVAPHQPICPNCLYCLKQNVPPRPTLWPRPAEPWEFTPERSPFRTILPWPYTLYKA